MLARGPTAFGYTAGVRESHEYAEALFHFLGRYLGNVLGMMNVRKTLGENKRMALVHLIKPDFYACLVTTLENHKENWGHQLTTTGDINKDNRSRYKNCKDLSPANQLK